jgi:uncharacterized protein
MLVSFSVQNFRSFASKQTISMVAGVGAAREKRLSFPSGNSLAPNLLRSACLFGPNGSGKSSLVMALYFFREFIISSAKDSQDGEKINIAAFKLDEEWKGKPTEFEAIFIHGESLYQYGFSVDSERVWEEWLFCKPNKAGARMRTLFQREYSAETASYSWDISKTNVKGEKEQWKKATRANSLFLSTAIHLNATSLKEPFEWVQKFLNVIGSLNRVSHDFTAIQCLEGGQKEDIIRFMNAVDIQIKDIEVKVGSVDDYNFGITSEEIREILRKQYEKAKILQVRLHHQGKSGQLIPFELKEESDGSQLAFNLAGPWLDVLKNGYTLIVDELHNSLHPHAIKFLVNLFHDPKINKNSAQLIFTSHETSIMANNFIHQDQIWLTEKDEDEQSILTPLSDYKVRDAAAFQKAYLDGRYGAVPRIKEFIDA